MVDNNLTFGQRQGIDSLPRQLELHELSQELRALLWANLYLYLDEYHDNSIYSRVTYPWKDILLRWHVRSQHKMIDNFSDLLVDIRISIKNIITNNDYIEVFNFLEFVIRDTDCPDKFEDEISNVLENCRAAYRIIDKTIVPIASEQEAQTIEDAFRDIADAEATGAKSHLRDAGSNLTAGNYADSVRHSISAVESIARLLSENSKTLWPALSELEKQGALHKALKEGFNKLYNFTSDEQGIRHALLDKDAANVDEADALYMLGACAAFVSYLLNKTK